MFTAVERGGASVISRSLSMALKVALKSRQRSGKPLVLLINGVHLLYNDSDGQYLLGLIQRRAELWPASNLVTVVLNSNDYWISERLIAQATRMCVVPVRDISKGPAIAALKKFRESRFGEHVSASTLERVYGRRQIEISCSCRSLS